MKAIVIMFDGNTPSDSVIAGLIATLRSAQRSGDVPATVTVLDDTTVAKTLVSAKTGATVKSVIIPPEVEETPQDKALIFIGTKYSPFIGINMDSFKRRLIQDFTIAQWLRKTQHENEESKALINAMKLLSENKYNVSRALMKKYNFTKTTLEAIINIYNLYKQ